MARAIMATPNNLGFIAKNMRVPLEELEELYDNRIDNGDFYIVLDYPTSRGRTVPWVDLPDFFVHYYFEFLWPESDRKFVPIVRADEY